MGLIAASIAFLDALDGGRTELGRAPAAQGPPPPQAPTPLGELVQAHAVKLAAIEASLVGLKANMQEVIDRAERAAERTRKAVQRSMERLEGGGGEPDADPGLQGDDAGSGPRQWVPSVSTGVEPPPESDEDFRRAVQRQVKFL